MDERTQRAQKAAELMVAYQGGSRPAFDALVGLLGPSIIRFFMHGFRDRATADDLYQDTWLKVHRARHTFRPGEPVSPWLFGIARHVAADHRRKFSRHRRRMDAAAQVAIATGDAPLASKPVDAYARVEAAELLALAMANLPETQREALFLLKVEGLSVQEAAVVAGTSPGALKVRAHRAYERIRAVVRDLAEDE